MTGTLPSYAVITEGRQHEVTVATTLTFGATTIAAIYNDHWQIEILFKALNSLSSSRPLWGPAPPPSTPNS